MNKEKLISILKGALIALSAGGTASLISYLSGLDWSQYGIWAQAVAAVVINALRKLLEKDTRKVETDE